MTVYVLHFDRPYQHAKHSLGSCQDLERRLTQQGKGRGARLPSHRPQRDDSAGARGAVPRSGSHCQLD